MTSARIYASGAIGFGGQAAINDLLAAGYDTVIVWSVHVDTNATLFLNDTVIVGGGNYSAAFPFNLPHRLAQLRKAGIKIIFSVGAGETKDFTNIGSLLADQEGRQALYNNFKALKAAMQTADGGDIDAIDFDNEDNMDANVMVSFGIMLADIGYANVTFCPWTNEQVWYDTMQGLVEAKGPDFVNAIHLQVYSGGVGNYGSVDQWKSGFDAAGGKALMIPGLATNQAANGPWWYNGQMGGSVIKRGNSGMFEGANWDNYLYTWNFATIEEALQGAQTAASFFFYCRAPLQMAGRSFRAGDAVFFAGLPTWGDSPVCDGYYLGGGCNNEYNPIPGACPKDLRAQYATWNKSYDGGFIWLYDSIVSCLQSGCCDPAATALAYCQAITG